jgi:PTH2 family peptidyl-tRNA hydrolase
MADYNAKQVIVMRNDLGMRKGKTIAQGAHAATAWLSNLARIEIAAGSKGLRPYFTPFSEAQESWLRGRFTKICVYVTSEEELMSIYEQAKEAKLLVELITDAGFTEFGGVPTKTCLAIGPDWNEKIDAVTGDLPLL